MLKKANIVYLIAIVVLMTTILISCGSVTKKDEIPLIDTQKEIKVSAKEDWGKFNKEAEIAIKERESQIEALRKQILIAPKKEQQKFNKTLDSLERKKNSLKTNLGRINKKLKTRLDNINESDKVLKSAFENAFVKDMNSLLSGLRDFWNTRR